MDSSTKVVFFFSNGSLLPWPLQLLEFGVYFFSKLNHGSKSTTELLARNSPHECSRKLLHYLLKKSTVSVCLHASSIGGFQSTTLMNFDNFRDKSQAGVGDGFKFTWPSLKEKNRGGCYISRGRNCNMGMA